MHATAVHGSPSPAQSLAAAQAAPPPSSSAAAAGARAPSRAPSAAPARALATARLVARRVAVVARALVIASNRSASIAWSFHVAPWSGGGRPPRPRRLPPPVAGPSRLRPHLERPAGLPGRGGGLDRGWELPHRRYPGTGR